MSGMTEEIKEPGVVYQRDKHSCFRLKFNETYRDFALNVTWKFS